MKSKQETRFVVVALWLHMNIKKQDTGGIQLFSPQHFNNILWNMILRTPDS